MQVNSKKILYVVLYLILLVQLVALGKKMKFSVAILTHAFSTNVAVIESLPSDVVDASALISRHSIKDFALSKTLGSDHLFRQRIVEYNYPARFNVNSTTMIAKTDEKEFSGCKEIDVKNSIGVYDCTQK